MRVLLLSAYDAPSHRRWRQGLVRALPHLDFHVLTLPPRHFSWRLRSNSMTFALSGDLRPPYDLILATSTVDLSALLGLAPALAHTPRLVYFHENQFAYPTRTGTQRNDIHFRIHDLYTALAADRLLFNSDHNRQTFLDGARDLLRAVPDGVPPGLPERLRERSHVLPVPLDDDLFLPHTPRTSPVLSLVWNHRWEYDKAPERLFQALTLLTSRHAAIKIHVLGQQFRDIPDAFSRAQRDLPHLFSSFGYVQDHGAYLHILRNSDLVISTALHEFQGLAILEAVASGCRPVLPDRLSYPELVPQECLYPSFLDDPDAEARALAAHLARLIDDPDAWRVSPTQIPDLRWGTLASDYARHISDLTPMSPADEP